METRYLDAERTLSVAELDAWQLQDFDTLSRLYLPLQEARRQIRQRCGEGAVAMHLLAHQPGESFDVSELASRHPHGQLLVGGWGTLAPAVELRELASRQHLYVQTFLAAVYPVSDSDPQVALVPLAESIPSAQLRTLDELRSLLPAHSLILPLSEIPADARIGTAETFAGVMALWERLHTPFLIAAAAEPDPLKRMQAYRVAIAVDSACELAHQFLADIARSMARRR
jgi:hypothetical protein